MTERIFTKISTANIDMDWENENLPRSLKPKKEIPNINLNKSKKIALAYNAFFHYFKRIYPDIKLIEDPRTVSKFDLVVFSGGEDISPEIYGEKNSLSHGINSIRDNAEIGVLHSWINSRNKPKLLGICRGHQLINCFFGGSLYQDFPSSTNEDGERFGYHSSPHNLNFHYDGILYKFFRDKLVSSLHHQAVRKTSSSLYTACVHNGIVEGLENDKIVTTQFHPEFDFVPGNHCDSFFKFLATEW